LLLSQVLTKTQFLEFYKIARFWLTVWDKSARFWHSVGYFVKQPGFDKDVIVLSLLRSQILTNQLLLISQVLTELLSVHFAGQPDFDKSPNFDYLASFWQSLSCPQISQVLTETLISNFTTKPDYD
jgi:hypothetical protein